MLKSIYFGALAEVNQIRQEKLNLPPLDKFPSCIPLADRAPGLSYCCYCPVAMALNGGKVDSSIAVTHHEYRINWRWTPWPIGSPVSEFIRVFDYEYQSPSGTVLDPWDLVTDV